MPEHSNFSFISHVSDLHTNVTIPRKLEGDVHVETTKGDIEVNKSGNLFTWRRATANFQQHLLLREQFMQVTM